MEDAFIHSDVNEINFQVPHDLNTNCEKSSYANPFHSIEIDHDHQQEGIHQLICIEQVGISLQWISFSYLAIATTYY